MIIGTENGCGRARQKNASFAGNGPRLPSPAPPKLRLAPGQSASTAASLSSARLTEEPRFQHLRLPAPASGVIITRHSRFQKAPWESYDILLQGFRGLQYLRVHAALRHRLLAP